MGERLRGLASDRGWVTADVSDVQPAGPATDLLLTAARRHRVSGQLHLALSRDPDHRCSDLLLHEHRSFIARHVRTVATLHDTVARLESAGVRCVVMKGPALSVLSYPRPDIRWYSDLDLLVRRQDVECAVELLEAAGSQLMDRNWDLINRERLGELHLVAPTGVAVDLHVDLVNNASRRARFRIDPAELVRRAVPVALSGRTCLTLDPADTVLHLAVHTALSGGDRLGWFSDLDQTLRNQDVDWTDVVVRARDWGASLLLHQMLLRCRSTLGSPVPDDVLGQLSPGRAWGLLVRGVQRMDPVQRDTGRLSPGRALARSAHTGTVATLAAAVLGRSSTAMGIRGSRFEGDGPDSPGSVFHDAGGASGRAHFFRRMSAEHPD